MKYLAAVLAALAASTIAAWCSPPPGRITVTATVQANCILRSPNSLDFGHYSSAQASSRTIDANANVLSIACTKGVPGASISLDNGSNYSGTHRNLGSRDGKSLIAYEIYTSPDHSTSWTTINTLSYVPTSDAATDVPMYGRAFPGPSPHPGHYVDTVMAMVNF